MSPQLVFASRQVGVARLEEGNLLLAEERIGRELERGMVGVVIFGPRATLLGS